MELRESMNTMNIAMNESFFDFGDENDYCNYVSVFSEASTRRIYVYIGMSLGNDSEFHQQEVVANINRAVRKAYQNHDIPHRTTVHIDFLDKRRWGHICHEA